MEVALAYSDHFRRDFEKMESEYIRSVQKGRASHNLGFLFTSAAVLAAAIMVLVTLNTSVSVIEPVNTQRNFTEIPMTPAVIGQVQPIRQIAEDMGR